MSHTTYGYEKYVMILLCPRPMVTRKNHKGW